MIKEEIRVYKDLKFMMLRLIYDYEEFNVRWLISMLLGIRICELIYLNWFLWVKMDRMVLRLKMSKFYFCHWFMKITV